ncbi:S-layer homology domain-containing protein [Paenibacillus kobensis]|uniref:S-layer homology domain-containing protein n=1 Tax=Paenibacillus kobensis TaxID=59841 RepID=UPI000FDB7A6C|nr:S-layer homology domain-containing protein [Paenibacillus kobensis]
MTVLRTVLGMLASLMGIVVIGAEAAPTFAAQAATDLPYDDIGNNYAKSAIISVTENHLMNGTGNRRFEPNKPVTRAEMTAMLDRALGIQPLSAPLLTYEDVPSDAWHYEWIQPAVQLGIAQGISASRFEPNRPVLREEAAVLLSRALKQPADTASDRSVSVYKDQKTIADWALPSVIRMYQLNLMRGDKDGFRPHDSITRQEAAVLLDRVWSHPDWAKQITASAPSRIHLGWQYGLTTAQFEQQILQSEVNTLSPRWFFLSPTGAFEDCTDSSLVNWAHQRGKNVWAMVGNRSDERSTHQMLSNPDQRNAFVQQLTDRVSRYGIDGLNIDFENMMAQDRDSFTLFITELHKQLLAVHAVLSVNVSPDFGTDWTDVFDYAALGLQAEYIVLMGYDEHWSTSPQAGSVSSLPWLQQGLEALLKKVSSRQIIAGFPLYTRDWTVTSEGSTVASDIELQKQNELILTNRATLQWDDRLGQYFSEYDDSLGAHHQIWLEDGRSISRKMSLTESHAVAGYAYWYMGGESADLWTSVRNAIRFQSTLYTP